MKVLITAGPTHEPIDPVRFIGNRSSGKMGYAIAKAFLDKNYHVELISGPVNIQLVHKNLNITKVESADEMYRAVMEHTDYKIAVMSAAVADFTPAQAAHEKIKKQAGQDEMSIRLVKTKDILATLGATKSTNQFLVGFALETNNEEEHAKSKLARKKADLIILNSMKDKGAGFGHDTNKATLFFKNGERKSLALMTKVDLGAYLVNEIEKAIL